MFENVYLNPKAKSEEHKAKDLMKYLFEHYSKELKIIYPDSDEIIIQRTASDYISGMTDRYAVKKFKELVLPKPHKNENREEFLIKLAKINGLSK